MTKNVFLVFLITTLCLSIISGCGKKKSSGGTSEITLEGAGS